MKQLIVATKNEHKMREIKEILKDSDYVPISMEESLIDIEIEETGTTFKENAYIKAKCLHELTGKTVIADDSGLEVDHLDKAPGVYSRRFGGENATDADKNKKLLNMLKDVPYEKRKARFVCAIAVVNEDGSSFDVEGTLDGYISNEPRGTEGFGYDPVLFLPEFGKTVAQLDARIKNEISHRGKALRKMKEALR